MDSVPSLELLGPFRFTRNGELVRMRRKSRALLAYLALAGAESERSDLCDLLFSASKDPAGALRWQLSQIRKLVSASAIVTASTRVSFDATGVAVDALEFAQALQRTETATRRAEIDIPQYVNALSRYRGDLLSGLTISDSADFELWLLGERLHYRRVYESALEQLVVALIRLEKFREAIPWARALVASDPLGESGPIHLSWLYARTLRQRDAIAQLEHFRRQQSDEFAAPRFAPHVEALHAALLGGGPVAHPLLEADAPPRRLAEAQNGGAGILGADSARSDGGKAPHNLPALSGALIGRVDELAQVTAMALDRLRRIVTLTGPGGIGKTRLALEAAHVLLAQRAHPYLDGIFFVELADMNSEEEILTTIAAAIGFSFTGGNGIRRQLLEHLAPRALLLLVDNFEHLAEQAALLAEIARAAPQLSLLVTSRSRLNLYEEWCIEIQGLALPVCDDSAEIGKDDAVQLFTNRAQQSDPHMSVDESLPAILRICRVLDGVPLAIELAASWVRVYSCQEIADNIDANFDFLETPLRNLPARHRSLRAVYDYSWRLLSAEDQLVCVQLSIFHRGFSTHAAETITGATKRTLARLAATSMIQRDRSGRFQMHSLLRQFAGERLSPFVAASLQQRHSRYFADYVNFRQQYRLTEGEVTAHTEIGREYANIAQGWQVARHCLRQERSRRFGIQALTHYTPMLTWFFRRYGRFLEGIELFQRAADDLRALCGQTPDHEEAILLAWLHNGCAKLYYPLSQFDKVRAHAEQGNALLAAVDAGSQRAELLTSLAMAEIRAGDLDRARRLLLDSRQLYDTSGESIAMANPLNALGMVAYMSGDKDAARDYWEQCLTIFRQTRYAMGISNLLSNLGTYYLESGQLERARAIYEEAHQLADRTHDALMTMITLHNLGAVAHSQGRLQDSIDLFQASIRIARRMHERRWTAAGLNGLAQTRFQRGDADYALVNAREAFDIAADVQSRRDALESLALIGAIHAQSDAPVAGLALLLFVRAQAECKPTTIAFIEEQIARASVELGVDAVALAQEEAQSLRFDALKNHGFLRST